MAITSATTRERYRSCLFLASQDVLVVAKKERERSKRGQSLFAPALRTALDVPHHPKGIVYNHTTICSNQNIVILSTPSQRLRT